MSKLPAISVLTCCHNYGRWLGEALLSVESQSYENKVLAVVDDGSQDNTWEVVRKFARIPREDFNTPYRGQLGRTPVIAFRLKNPTGPSNARNIAIQLTAERADLFCPLDADDQYLPSKLSKSVAKWLEDPQRIVGVYTDYDTFNEDGIVVREFKPPFDKLGLLSDNMVHSACMFSKWAIEKAGIYDQNLRVAEDLDLWLRLSDFGLILHIPEALMRVRVGLHGSSSSVPKAIWQRDWSRVMEKAKERFARAAGTR